MCYTNKPFWEMFFFPAVPLLWPHAEAEQTNGVAKLRKIYINKQKRSELHPPDARRDKPEVVHELLELVGASGQRHDDVDGHVGRVHALVLHLHQRPEGTEEDQAAELAAGLASEAQLVQRPLVLLRAGDAWAGGTGPGASV